jgi:prepilin-type N-terminal cleavage/methylation domain-containing protein
LFKKTEAIILKIIKKTVVRNKRQTGFTLIELLVVIAIIGLLSSVIILGLNSARVKSRDAKRLSEVKQVSSALELYFNQNNAYPSAYASLTPSYLTSLPTYPTPVDSPCVTSTYAYSSAGQSTYQLLFCISATTGGVSPAGTHTLTQGGLQ